MAAHVSTIMPIYKPNPAYLKAQLESIDAQEYRDMDIVVLNDCPDDKESEALVRSCVKKHELHYIPGTVNRGYVKAFEYLVEQAEGEYLALSDQDDVWLADRIKHGVKALEEGHLLSVCDRQVIDDRGGVIIESWRKANSASAQDNWNTQDRFVAQAVFTCYAIGMATMIRADAAKQMTPFPLSTGHDKWLAMGANCLGSCAYIDLPLVQYRRHQENQTGRFQGIFSKHDWYEKRTRQSLLTAEEFVKRYPNCPENSEILAFARARMNKNVAGMLKYRHLAPSVATFEIALKFMPELLFKQMLRRS